MPIILIIKNKETDKIYNVEVDPLDKVQGLLDELYDSIGLSKSKKIQLTHNGKVLALDQNFQENQIPKGAQLMLEILQNQEILQQKQYLILTFNCNEKHRVEKMEIQSEDSVQTQMDKLEKMYGLNANSNVDLFLNGQLLNPNKTFASCNVQDHDQIEVKIRRIGG